MYKSTITTYNFLTCSMHISNADEEIMFNDHSSNEILSIEGVDPNEIRSAIKCYVHNMSLRIDDKEQRLKWLKDMKSEVSAAISRLETATKE